MVCRQQASEATRRDERRARSAAIAAPNPRTPWLLTINGTPMARRGSADTLKNMADREYPYRRRYTAEVRHDSRPTHWVRSSRGWYRADAGAS